MTHSRRIAIVTGHFPPSNLAGVHRSRLWAQYLPEFGWEPIIVTAHSDYYEEQLDPVLLELVSPELRVIRTRAIPVEPVRLVGDIGIRALYWQFKVLDELVRRKEIDFLHITIPSNYTALLGEALYRQHSFPFGIDYQDPWVHILPSAEKSFSKAWMSWKLAQWLEPWAVKNVALITGVAPLYYEPVLERNPHLRDRCITAAMPIGNSEGDYRYLRDNVRETFLFPENDALFHMIYAGAMLPKSYTVLECLLSALVTLQDRSPELIEQLRIHFVGTGASPDDPKGHNILPLVRRFGLERYVDEKPNRISYIDVLNHLVHASAILILGSTEAHYTPSKVYQAVQAQRPIFALLHEKSTAAAVLRESRAGQIVTFGEGQLPDAQELASTLAAFIKNTRYSAEGIRWDAFECYSARNSSRALAGAVDQALELFKQRR
jgi:hypothetical protein